MMVVARGASAFTSFRLKGIGAQRRGDGRGAERHPLSRFARVRFAPHFAPKGKIGIAGPFISKGEG